LWWVDILILIQPGLYSSGVFCVGYIFVIMGNSRFHLVVNHSSSSLFLFYIHMAFESPTLREAHRLKGLKNRVLGKIYRLKREEVTGV
jgi:hypothetical protein